MKLLLALMWVGLGAAQVMAQDPAAVPAAAADGSMRVMSLNIRLNTPRDGVNAWPHRKQWVAQIITDQRIDLLGTQEVKVDQYKDLQAGLPHMAGYGVGRDDGKEGGEFSAVFYRKDRYERLDQGTMWLSPTPDVPGSVGWDAAITRVASWVKLKDKRTGIVFYFINTHFDHRGREARKHSAALLRARLNEQFNDHPVILTGDFNTPPKSDPFLNLVEKDKGGERRYVDSHDVSRQKPVGPDSTFNGFKAIRPGARIDYVFVTPDVTVFEHHILTDQKDGRFPSDHLPVVSVVKLPK